MILSPIKRFAGKYLRRLATESNYKFIVKDWLSLGDLEALSKALESKRFTRNLEPLVMDMPKAQRVLVISPHPDDDVFSSGGTMLKLAKSGCLIKVLYLTSGKEITYKDGQGGALADGAERIEKEARAASKILGTDIEFWRYPAGGLKINDDTVKKIRKAFFEFEPQSVFLPFIADDHDDHRRGSRLFYEAFRDCKELDFEVWAYQVYSTVIPNVAVDITDQMEKKTALIELWESRKESRDWAHYIKGLNAFNSRFLKTNEPRYAEVFFVVPALEYIELCGVYFKNER